MSKRIKSFSIIAGLVVLAAALGAGGFKMLAKKIPAKYLAKAGESAGKNAEYPGESDVKFASRQITDQNRRLLEEAAKEKPEKIDYTFLGC
jgi:hypothetical protein